MICVERCKLQYTDIKLSKSSLMFHGAQVSELEPQLEHLEAQNHDDHEEDQAKPYYVLRPGLT